MALFLQLGVALLTYGYTLSFDESVWHYIGRNWFRSGLAPYRGGVDNKSPLIYLVFGLSDRLFGVNYWFPRVAGAVCQLAGIWFLYKTALQWAGRRAGILVISMYGLSLLWRGTGGKYVSSTETYSMTVAIVAFYYFGQARFFVSGLLAGLAFAFRGTAVILIPILFVFSFRRLYSRYTLPADRLCIPPGRYSALSFVIGVLACLSFLAAAAQLAGIRLADLWDFGFADNFGKGSLTDRTFEWRWEHFINGFFYSEIILFYPLLLGYYLIKKRIDILIVWFAGGCAAISCIGLYDPAHFKDLLPPLSLAGALAIDHLVTRYGFSFRKCLLIIWISFLPKLTEPVICLWRILYPPVAASPDSYCHPPYSPLDNRSRKELGLWIRANTDVHDKVLIAGHGEQIQVYTERLSPSIYFDASPTERGKGTFYRQVADNRPGLVAIPLSGDYQRYVDEDVRSFIQKLVSTGYRTDTCLYGYTIYKLERGKAGK